MAEGRTLAGLTQVYQSSLDRDPAGAGRLLPCTETCGDMTTTEAGAGLLASFARVTAAGFVGLAQHLVDECLSALFRFPGLRTEALFVVLIAFLAHPEDSPN
ncbi:hypothetical protein D3C84_1006440 [compost metagenome]